MQEQINQWLEKLGDKPIPILGNTINDLSSACASDKSTVKDIVDIVERDPGLTVQLLRTCSQKSRSSLQADVNSVHQAVMMMGTQAVSSIAARLPTVEKSLQDNVKTQVLFTFTRAYYAGLQAMDWARQRRDMTPDEVFASAQLHFLGEMVLSLYAPEKLQEIFAMRMQEHVASEEAQYVILGFTLDQLSLEIAKRWNLPRLVSEALHAENARFPRAYGVMLAVQLARHATINWYSDETRQTLQQAAEWLGKEDEIDKVIATAHRTAAEAARGASFYAVKPAAAQLVQVVSPPDQNNIAVSEEQNTDEQTPHAGICLTPQLTLLKTQLKQLTNPELCDQQGIISLAMEALHDGIGLNRVVFAVLNEEQNLLTTQAVIGAENDPAFNRLKISLKQPHLFYHLMEKMQGLWLNDQNREKFWSLVPKDFQRVIMINSFMTMSIFINNTPVGLVYADRHTVDCALDPHTYHYFKTVCTQFAKALGRVKKLNFDR